MKPLTALIDGDVLLYSICRGNERDADFGDIHVLYSDFDECRGILQERLEEILDVTRCGSYEIHVSHKDNWRKDLMPGYKNHRKDVRKPLAFGRLKSLMLEYYRASVVPRLEADDTLGMRSRRGENMIVSLDKDFFAVPGTFARIAMDHSITIYEVSEDEARFNHFIQALMGDRVDGYPGCPGIGKVSAPRKINAVVSQPGRVRSTEALAVWKMLTSLYEAEGVDLSSVHENYMVSRILYQPEEYNYETREVRIQLPTGVIFTV